MTQDNIKRLKAVYEAFSREDFDALVAIADPEIELVRPGQGTTRGVRALREWAEPDALEDHTVEPLHFETSGNKILARQRHQARGAASGIQIDAEIWMVWTFGEDGRVLRAEAFILTEEDRARKAAGLSA